MSSYFATSPVSFILYRRAVSFRKQSKLKFFLTPLSAMKTAHLHRELRLHKFRWKEVNFTAGSSSLLYAAGCTKDRINFVAKGRVRITRTELMKNTAVKER